MIDIDLKVLREDIIVIKYIFTTGERISLRFLMTLNIIMFGRVSIHGAMTENQALKTFLGW